MSPIIRKHACRCAATALTALALWNCSGDSRAESPLDTIQIGETAKVALNLDYSETPLLDSISMFSQARTGLLRQSFTQTGH